jgi:CheY-like chemotaxis protein
MLSIRKPTVLAVDDKRANLLALEGLLANDYDLLFAASGREAIALVEKHPHVDAILLDVQMPIMDGFETAAAIKRLEAGRDIPIIFITAVYTEDPHVKRGYEVGGIDYFGKPFDPEILKLKLRIYASFRTRENLLRQREHSIRESEELLRVGRKLSAVLESLRVGVLIVDLEGRICQTTEEVTRIFNVTQPLQGDLYGEILGWWGRDGAMIKSDRGVLQCALGGESAHAEPMSIKCFDGSSKLIQASASPLHGLDGRPVGAVVLIQDMTEPRSIESALAERVTRLIQAGVELEETAVRPA